MERDSGKRDIYQKEFDFLEKSRELFQSKHFEDFISTEFFEISTQILEKYEKLLKEIVKITWVGDKNQKKLLQAHEKIEKQQEELKLSYQQIEQKNAALAKAYQEMESLARFDPLTGLSNRRYLLEKINEEMVRQQRSQKPFALIISDIDNFKSINDTHGHDSGDYIIKTMGSILNQSVRAMDWVGRWGGEEFLVFLPETDPDGGMRVAERIRQNILTHSFEFNDQKFSPTMTLGVSVCTVGTSMDVCLKKADEALYQGKSKGKNQVLFR